MKVGSEQCTVPCNVTVYEPSLSSAQLSAINIERLVLSNNTRQFNVKLQYLRALEALQRVDRFIIRDDENVNKSLVEKAAELRERLAQLTEAVGDKSPMAELLTSMSNWILDDENYVHDLKHNLEDIVSMEKGYIEYCESIYVNTMTSDFANGRLSDLIECTENVQPANVSLPMYSIEHYKDKDFLDKCTWDDSSRSMESYSSESLDSGEILVGTKSPEEIEKKCRDTISTKLSNMNDAYMYSNAIGNYLQNLKTLYMSTVLNVFNDTNRNYSEVEEHATCVLALDELASIDIMSQAEELMRAALEAGNYTTLTTAATQLNDLLGDDPFGNFTQKIDKVMDACWWMENMIQNKKSVYEYSRNKFIQAETEASKLQDQRVSLEGLLLRIEHHFSTQIAPIIDLTNEYLARSITKVDMARNFTSAELSTALTHLMALDSELSTLLGDFLATAGTFKVYLNGGYDLLFDLVPPVMNTSNIRGFNVLRYAGQNHSADGNAKLIALWDDLAGTDKENTIDDIIDNIVAVNDLSISIHPSIHPPSHPPTHPPTHLPI
jgi:predicted nucleic acid-binding protein